MAKFYWVRHGPTHQKNFVGWRDVPADLSNSDQISRLEAYLPKDALVVSSDLRRSVDTATAITGSRQRLPHIPGLREFNFGAWDGKKFDAIADRWPELSRAYWERPGDIAPPGGESWHDGTARMWSAADHLARRFEGRSIVAVAHIGVVIAQLQKAMGATAVDPLSHKIDNLSVTEIDLSGPSPVIGRINHIP